MSIAIGLSNNRAHTDRERERGEAMETSRKSRLERYLWDRFMGAWKYRIGRMRPHRYQAQHRSHVLMGDRMKCA